MNTKIQVFNHEQFGQIRTMTMPDGQVGFVGKDVATVLGYSNPTKAIIMHVVDDDKTSVMMEAQSQNGILVKTKTTLINESGLYALIFASKLPKAREFKHWVTSVVLPQIRQTGGYIPVNEEDDEKTILCKALNIMQKTIEKKDDIIEKLRPKAEYAEGVLLSPSCFTMTQIAKDLSMTVLDLTRRLLEKGIIYRSPSGPYMLYAKYLGNGYEAYRTKSGHDMFGNILWTDNYLVWTEKGREFIHQLIK